ncbi:MAG: transcriptional repressor [Desulfovibrio sp.]|jgi:Fur family zinc uptake transcriptional regulator|nr:transcriptional repressor [Desulfovibrio sp.]
MSERNPVIPDCPAEAENPRGRQGVRLTSLRRAILEILMAADFPVKAYDLIEYMRDKGKRVTPATIYRTLDFLLQNGLVHRVNSLNAYIPCTGEHNNHALLMVTCSGCQKTTEIDDQDLYDSMRSRLEELGMSLQGGCIEIQGMCKECMRYPQPSTG